MGRRIEKLKLAGYSVGRNLKFLLPGYFLKLAYEIARDTDFVKENGGRITKSAVYGDTLTAERITKGMTYGGALTLELLFPLAAIYEAAVGNYDRAAWTMAGQLAIKAPLTVGCATFEYNEGAKKMETATSA